MNFDWKDVIVILIVATCLVLIATDIGGCVRQQQKLQYWCVQLGHTKAECNLGL